MTSTIFAYNQSELEGIADRVIAHAKSIGATDASIRIVESDNLSVGVRNSDVDVIQRRHEKRAQITLYVGESRGGSLTSDFSPDGLKEATSAAYDIAVRTSADPYSGLLEEGDYARPVRPAPDLFHEWEISVQDAIAIANDAESAALGSDRGSDLPSDALPEGARLTSGGARLSVNHGQFLMATSKGFAGGYPFSKHNLSCHMVAANEGGMQSGDWRSIARAASDLEGADFVGRMARNHALARLDAKRLKTCTTSVLFEARVANALIDGVLSALTGGAQFRRQSFLLDCVGKPIMADHLSLYEDPMRGRGLGSSPFDSEGVATRERALISDGVAQTYLLDSYSARRLSLPLTGHAGGVTNVTLKSAHANVGNDFAAMVARMGRGLIVTDVLGGSLNSTTGDYSQGIAGFWVEGGEIRFPVEEVTIAASFPEMLTGILAVGSDEYVSGAVTTGSILVEQMRVAGL